MLERHPEVKKDIDTILDCFGGADGGIGFVRLCTMLEDLSDKWENEGDPAAEQLLQLVTRFARLINVSKTTKLT